MITGNELVPGDPRRHLGALPRRVYRAGDLCEVLPP